MSGANIELRKHVFGIESHITECDWELDVRLDEGATGYIADQVLTFVTTNFCLEPTGGGSDETCEIDVPFVATGTDRHQLGQASEFPSHGTTGFRCELIGTLDSETGAGGDHVAWLTGPGPSSNSH